MESMKPFSCAVEHVNMLFSVVVQLKREVWRKLFAVHLLLVPVIRLKAERHTRDDWTCMHSIIHTYLITLPPGPTVPVSPSLFRINFERFRFSIRPTTWLMSDWTKSLESDEKIINIELFFFLSNFYDTIAHYALMWMFCAINNTVQNTPSVC